MGHLKIAIWCNEILLDTNINEYLARTEYPARGKLCIAFYCQWEIWSKVITRDQYPKGISSTAIFTWEISDLYHARGVRQ